MDDFFLTTPSRAWISKNNRGKILRDSKKFFDIRRGRTEPNRIFADDRESMEMSKGKKKI